MPRWPPGGALRTTSHVPCAARARCAGWDQEVATQHHAFAVGDDEFDRIVDRLVAANIEHWADHTASQPSTHFRDSTGNGVHFRNPDGHLLEVLTHS